VADPDFQIREGGGGGGHPGPEIKEEPRLKFFFGPSGLSFV